MWLTANSPKTTLNCIKSLNKEQGGQIVHLEATLEGWATRAKQSDE